METRGILKRLLEVNSEKDSLNEIAAGIRLFVVGKGSIPFLWV